jgi:hypothetical protein
MEKFSDYSGINSAISDLAAVISDKLAKADSQISELGVSCRPNLVTQIRAARAIRELDLLLI